LLTASIEPLVVAYEERRQRDQTKLEQMVVYAQTALCRTHVLLRRSAKPSSGRNVAPATTAAVWRFVRQPWLQEPHDGLALDPSGGLKPPHSSRALLAMLCAVTVSAGLKAFLGWPARCSSASTRKRETLIAYLRDHLTGSDAAIRVVHRLGSMHHGTDGTLFDRLFKEFEEDRSVVHALLAQLGASGRLLKRAAGVASGTVLSVTAGHCLHTA
jgi:hypothetical protein